MLLMVSTTVPGEQQRRMFRFHQVTPMLCACILTWSIGRFTNFFVPVGNKSRQRIVSDASPSINAYTINYPHYDYRQVHFLDLDQLNLMDHFSGTWLQPVNNFLRMNLSQILTVEDGCHQAFRENKSAARMTLDWLDFSVEHLSKWWKIARIFEESAVPFNKAVTSLQSYTRNVRNQIPRESPLEETLAIVTFQPYGHKAAPTRGRPLTVSSLAATMASLLKVGFGRVVIVGLNETDQEMVHETFGYLRDTLDNDPSSNQSMNDTQPITRIGPIEVGYVAARSEETKTKFVNNIPRGAISILQDAFKGDLDPPRTQQVLGTTIEKSFWKYVYLTEPDIILQTKPWVLPQLKQALDQGLNLFPHRLQPLPHEADFIGMEDDRFFVKNEGNFSQIIDLDSLNGAVCCDEQRGTYKPWKDYLNPACELGWWTCGFPKYGNGNHCHLLPYSLMRLKQGIGIVHLAATNHGRRCVPKEKGECVPSVEIAIDKQ